MQSVNSPSINANPVPQTNITYAQSNLYKTLQANHAGSDIEQNIVTHIDSIYKSINKIDENFNEIKSSLESSLAVIEPKTRIENKSNNNDKFDKELLINVIIAGAIGYLPWVIGDFYFAENYSSCQINSSSSLSKYLNNTGILGLGFIILFSLVYLFGGLTRKSYNQTEAVKMFYYVFCLSFGINGIGFFLNNLKEFSKCAHQMSKYFVSRSIANICYPLMYFTSLMKKN